MNKKNATQSKKRSVGRPAEGESGLLKDQILAAYLEICSTEGIESVTLQKVADRSRVALTSVRYHFQLKGLSLSQVAMEYVSAKTYEWVNAALLKARSEPDFNPVLAYVNIHFDWIQHRPLEASFLVYYYYLSTTKVPITIQNKELVEIAQRRVLGLLHEALGMKLYSFDGDTMALAQEIQLIVMGGCMNAATSRDEDFSQQQRRICIKLITQLFRV
ncbi:MAG: TetR/AcrR family transcriptional regulator [Pseudobdellovibrionaceae bacterium]